MSASRSYITPTSRPSPITIFLTSLRNHDQLSFFSFSTNPNAKGTSLRFASIPIAIINVPSYLPVRKVPSIDITSQQCLKASMHYKMSKKPETISASHGHQTYLISERTQNASLDYFLLLRATWLED